MSEAMRSHLFYVVRVALLGVCAVMAACTLTSDFDQFRCTSNADCSGSATVCDLSRNGCVGCVTDGDCPAGAPICLEEAEQCAECRTSDDCSQATAAGCDPATNTCVACVSDTDCASIAGAAVCSDGVCVECTADRADACTGATPSCDPGSSRCMGCVQDADCEGTTPACGPDARCVECTATNDAACAGETPQCAVDEEQCVECLQDADCPEAEPACGGDRTCGPCTIDDDCAGRAGPACDSDSGRCVECTADADCAGRGCDLQANVCSTFDAGTRFDCQSCVSDLDCGTSSGCIEMSYMSSTLGAFCLRRVSEGCTEPFGVSLRAESLSGAAQADYCGVDTNTTSCPAVRGLLDNTSCDTGADDQCAGPGALCRMVGAFSNRCTYPCGSAGDCPSSGAGSTCNAGYCGS